MKLLTQTILKRFAALGSQDHPDAVVVCKFFDPQGSWTWYATEWHPDHCDGGAFFGLVDGFEPELGYFALEELQRFRGALGLGIERDLHWTEQPLSQVRRRIDERRPTTP